jgi:predicted phosphoribosyltransferase
VVDDGIATGSTMTAALQTIRTQEPSELIVAVPVVPADRIRTLHEYCDNVVCLVHAEHFWSVGQFYEEFPAIDEEHVLDILRHLAPQRA